jgi:hypothetical protein
MEDKLSSFSGDFTIENVRNLLDSNDLTLAYAILYQLNQ